MALIALNLVDSRFERRMIGERRSPREPLKVSFAILIGFISDTNEATEERKFVIRTPSPFQWKFAMKAAIEFGRFCSGRLLLADQRGPSQSHR